MLLPPARSKRTYTLFPYTTRFRSLLFALMSREAPHVLILDEPTNHLDIDSRQALIQALSEFEGAVILVSHDPHLVELAADRLWLVADGTVSAYAGDLDDYLTRLLEQRRVTRPPQRAQQPAPPHPR